MMNALHQLQDAAFEACKKSVNFDELASIVRQVEKVERKVFWAIRECEKLTDELRERAE